MWRRKFSIIAAVKRPRSRRIARDTGKRRKNRNTISTDERIRKEPLFFGRRLFSIWDNLPRHVAVTALAVKTFQRQILFLLLFKRLADTGAGFLIRLDAEITQEPVNRLLLRFGRFLFHRFHCLYSSRYFLSCLRASFTQSEAVEALTPRCASI